MKCVCGTSGMEWKVTFVIGTLEFFNFNFFCMFLCGRQTAGAELTSEFDSPLRRTGGENDFMTSLHFFHLRGEECSFLSIL